MNRLRSLFSQFHIIIALRLLIVDICRKLLDPNRISTYSQTGEDRIIDFYLKDSERPYYVDIGCNDPFVMSNTMRLYQHGGRGLAVDANPKLVSRYKRIRLRDTCVCACVSSEVGEKEFIVSSNDAMSTLSKEFERNFLIGDSDRSLQKVTTVTCQELFMLHNVPYSFDLLTIDVEGHDFEVVKSFDLNQYRPKLIVIEMHNITLTSKSLGASETYCYLINNGYQLCAFCTMNGYFIRDDISGSLPETS